MVYRRLLLFFSFFGGLAIKVILGKEMLNMFYMIYRILTTILRDTNFVYLLKL